MRRGDQRGLRLTARTPALLRCLVVLYLLIKDVVVVIVEDILAVICLNADKPETDD